LLVAGAACSSDDENKGTGAGGNPATGGTPAGGGVAGGGAGGVAGSGPTASPYQAIAGDVCAKYLALGCPNDQQSACVTTLTSTGDLRTTSGCGTQQMAFYQCLGVAPATDFICDANGQATYKPGVCSTEESDLGTCTQ
jgi:hypothetical protein